ncbi:Putative secreted protein [[Actinomadura] parvosata subsp. kistnae]|uniref:Heavy metal-binding domain-containing protein n=1 Tax=[Actinomadura] parvosata subsp. kistnae TaxID=1909395 RepID=A0A1V0AH65_9ACTN|nr:hypothetical protein [Nonomuraea sp. ATCC 55076]AQZ69535.1 hypothetical protein BKM31_55910 [Nonomuraea sp. ATCC 55076]SPL91794.1 Putative secreted protein [Actinomadura parvosata subsp. kistnae]
MNTAVKLGSYVLGLAVVFGGALGVGKVVGPVGAQPAAENHAAMAAPTPSASAAHGEHATAPVQDDTPGGLQVSENGYTLDPITTALKPGEPADFRFTVTGPDGKAVTGYQVEHDKKLHLIVASRDLATFQHVHPEMAADGVWSVQLTLPKAGPYRAFADFAPTGGEGLTLGADVFVAGDYQPEALPQQSRTATVDGYEVTLDGDLTPGQSSRLTLKVSKDGKPVTDLQPYLGAYGHLVALRARDLAYLHVHPDGEPGDGKTQAGPEIVFYAEVPSTGDYRLFLDFQHEGKVRTADFTLSAGERPQVPTPTPTPTPTGHDDDGHGH